MANDFLRFNRAAPKPEQLEVLQSLSRILLFRLCSEKLEESAVAVKQGLTPKLLNGFDKNQVVRDVEKFGEEQKRHLSWYGYLFLCKAAYRLSKMTPRSLPQCPRLRNLKP